MMHGYIGFVRNNYRKDIIEPVIIISEYIDNNCHFADVPLEYWNVKYERYGYYSVHLKSEVYETKEELLMNS
jgi:hypothetical protein